MPFNRFQLGLSLFALCLGMSLASAPIRANGTYPVLPSGTRGPIRITFSGDAKEAFIAESDTGTVAVVDCGTHAVSRRFPALGKGTSAAVPIPDGGLLVVNTFSGDVQLLDAGTGQRRASVRLPGEPSDLCLLPNRDLAVVSIAQMNDVAVLKLPSLAIERRIPVGQRPQALTLSRDGKSLYAANFRSGDVSILDTAELRESTRVPTGGINLRDMTLSEDGKRAYVTGQVPIASRKTADPLEIWSNALFELDVEGAPKLGRTLTLDGPLPAPDPEGVALLPDGRAVIAIGGADRVGTFRLADGRLLAQGPTGARPRGLALSPDGKSVWVANELASTITVLDAGTLKPTKTIDLGPSPQRDFRMDGRFLFSSAGLTKGGRFTCNTCHPDGGTDGQNWQFVHVPDSVEKRNTKDLRGELTVTAPYRWSGHGRELEEFIQDELTGLLGSPRQPHDVLHSFWNLFSRLPEPAKPYRDANGAMTAAARRGKTLFDGKAGCGSCHEGEQRGGTGRKAWVGTTAAGLQLDVPHLHGVHGTAPYLHDGRAATLEEVFTHADPEHRHGRAHTLSPADFADLLRYVREL